MFRRREYCLLHTEETRIIFHQECTFLFFHLGSEVSEPKWDSMTPGPSHLPYIFHHLRSPPGFEISFWFGEKIRFWKWKMPWHSFRRIRRFKDGDDETRKTGDDRRPNRNFPISLSPLPRLDSIKSVAVRWSTIPAHKRVMISLAKPRI